MNKISYLIILVALLLSSSCSDKNKENVLESERIITVDSKLVFGFDPIHNKERPFLNVQFIDIPNKWYAISHISNFDYKEGYIYKLRVLEKRVNDSQLAEDQLNVSYYLIEIISKEEVNVN